MRLIDADALLEKLSNKNAILLSALIREQRTTAFYVYCKVVETIEKMPTIDAVPVWVSVKDRLPTEATGCVLVCMPDGRVRIGQYSEYSKRWYIGDMCGVGGDEPISWMPLPEPPKEVSE